MVYSSERPSRTTAIIYMALLGSWCTLTWLPLMDPSCIWLMGVHIDRHRALLCVADNWLLGGVYGLTAWLISADED